MKYPLQCQECQSQDAFVCVDDDDETQVYCPTCGIHFRYDSQDNLVEFNGPHGAFGIEIVGRPRICGSCCNPESLSIIKCYMASRPKGLQAVWVTEKNDRGLWQKRWLYGSPTLKDPGGSLA